MAIFYPASRLQQPGYSSPILFTVVGASSRSHPSIYSRLKCCSVTFMSLRSARQFGALPQVRWGFRCPERCATSGRLTVCSENIRRPQVDPDGKIGKASTSKFELGMDELVVKKKPSSYGIFLILLINLGIYVADHWLRLAGVRTLYLYHDFPRWYQFITSTFCHLSWNHLSSNLFFLYIFGKLVEEEGGSFAVWLSYIITGVGANLVSWLILPRSVVSAGASGAVFGLFAVSVLVKLSFDWRKILEVLILGQFVVERVMEAAHASAQLGGHVYNSSMNINHIAHLSGALIGVALIYVLRCLPSGGPEKK